MKSILLIGLGRFGRHIAQELNELGHQVMAIDSNEDRVNAVLSYVTNAQIGDSTSEYFLRSLGVGNFDVCIVTIGGNFQSSLETTSLLKELGAKLVHSAPFSNQRRGEHQCDDQRNIDCPREYTEQILVAKDVGCIVGAHADHGTVDLLQNVGDANHHTLYRI